MKNCLNCKYAEWKKTKSGRLHPSGDGQCKYPWKMPELPQSMCWLGFDKLTPSGGFIYRNKELKDHCFYFVHDNLI